MDSAAGTEPIEKLKPAAETSRRSGCLTRIRAWPENRARCLNPRAGVVLTLAPAGSGKTRVLTRRVVEAVRGGIDPGRILCVVFNKAASEVMSERIHGDAGLPDVHIRTLHSLGYEICRQAPDSPYAGYGVVTDQTLPGGLTDLFRKVLKEDFRAARRRRALSPFPNIWLSHTRKRLHGSGER